MYVRLLYFFSRNFYIVGNETNYCLKGDKYDY